MSHNFLEQLVAEWYEYQGYFIRRNVLVGKRPRGGYESELDVVGFHPEKRALVQIEPSMDAASWAQREKKYRRKFDAGKRHIPTLFAGLCDAEPVEQIALLVFAGTKRKEVGGGTIVLIQDFLREISAHLRTQSIYKQVVQEQFSILRTLQFAEQYRTEL